MIYDGFVGSSNVTQSPIASQEDLINWYVEEIQAPAAPSRTALYPTPGVSLLSTLAGGGPGSAHFSQNGREFAVIGTSFVEVNSTGSATILGTVAVATYPATISSNGPGGGQIFVTSGNNGYILTLATNVFTQVRTGATTQGDALDGYFIALDASTGTIYVSALLDGTTWDPTQFAQRSAQSDPWIAMKVSPANRYIYLFGSQTSEVWYDAGTFPFPFALHPSGPIPYGCAAAFSPAVCDGTVAWLGAMKSGQGAVFTASGLSATDVSTFALRFAISQYPLISDSVGDSYNDLGHLFYLLTFPTAAATWAYDFSTQSPQQWAKRGTWIAENNAFTFWRPMFHAFAFGQHRMLDLNSGSIYWMDSTIGTDIDGRPIRRVRRAPALQFEHERVYYSSFEIDLEAGLGITQPNYGLSFTGTVNGTPTGDTYVSTAPTTSFWAHTDGVSVVGDKITRTRINSGLSDSGGVSSKTLSGDGYVEYTVADTTPDPMIGYFGLTHIDGSHKYPDAIGAGTEFYPAMNYALFIDIGLAYAFYEDGVFSGAGHAIATGDLLRMEVSGTSVLFKKNGSLIATASAAAVTFPMVAYVAIQAPGTWFDNLILSGAWS